MITASMFSLSRPASCKAAAAACDASAGAWRTNRACSASGVRSNASLKGSSARCRLAIPLSPSKTFFRTAFERAVSWENCSAARKASQHSRWR